VTPTKDDTEPTGAQTGTDRDGDPTDAPNTDEDGQEAGTATQAPTDGTQSTDVGEGSPGNETGAGDAGEGTDDDGVGAGLVVAAVAVLAGGPARPAVATAGRAPCTDLRSGPRRGPSAPGRRTGALLSSLPRRLIRRAGSVDGRGHPLHRSGAPPAGRSR
jgi:hypothetical protein